MVRPTETTSYFATSKSNNCESSLRTEYVVTVKSLADANNYELTKTSEIYTGTTVTLQTGDVNVNNNAGAVESIYFKQNGSNVTPINVGDYEVYITTAATDDICTGDIKIGIFEITCPPIAAPAITPSATVCAGTQVTLSNYNGVNDNTVKWYSDEECNSEVTEQVTLTNNATKYYAKAYHKESGCYSSEYSTLTFTVNPLPTITSISASNDEPVLFEDVVLTATDVTQGAEVKWYKGDNDTPVATGTTYIVTSENAGEVIVKAKAFLNGCESEVATKTVKFGAENCASDNKIIIECTSTTGDNLFCYAFYGDNKTKIFGGWPGTKGNANGNTYTWTIEDKDDVTIIFNAGNNTNQTDDLTGHEKGKKYYYTFDSSKSKDNNPENYTLTKTEDILKYSLEFLSRMV